MTAAAPALTDPSPSRIVQGMIVANYTGQKGANTLHVFNIPDTEHDTFMGWLDLEHDKLADDLRHADGFTPLGTRSQLSKVAAQYRREQNNRTEVGWRVVPMRSNSIVLWRGPHCVLGATANSDRGGYRTALYLNLLASPPQKLLPRSPCEEHFSSSSPPPAGESQEPTAIDDAVAKWLDPIPYGWNAMTIPANHQHMFAARAQHHLPAHQPLPPQSSPQRGIWVNKRPSKELKHLNEHGYVVIENALPDNRAEVLNSVILGCCRGVLMDIPRKGMCARLQKEVARWSHEEFATRVNEPKLKKARYFKHNSTDLFCGYNNTISDQTHAHHTSHMKNLQSAAGFRLNTQMIDVHAHPYFADCLASVHSRLQDVLGIPRLYFGKERCSLRSHGSRELPPHVDEPIRRLGLSWEREGGRVT
jgi:hypothetical protein